MRKTAKLCGVSLLLVAALLLSVISPISIKTASAHPGKLMWSIVDTPSPDNNIIVTPSEVNIIVTGYDDSAFYAVDIPNAKVYKSTSGGVWWQPNLISDNLPAGALPVWNLAVAPDDVNFLVVITDGGGLSGPKQVFVSKNGGSTWEDANFTPLPGEYISCVDISMTYGADRDIAVATRDGGGNGKIYVRKYPVSGGNWNPQDATGAPASIGWAGGDVVAAKFSPTYATDETLVVIYSDGTGTFLNAGQRDLNSNFTDWSAIYATPVELTTAGLGSSPGNLEIITADLELPSDFSGTNPSLRRFYVSTDAVAGPQSGVYRVDNDMVYYIKPPTTVPTNGRISSIAYFGTYAGGQLLAGEVEADSVTGMVYIWRTSDPISNTPTWHKSDDYKSPTGGGRATPAPVGNFANAQVDWSFEGTRAYCGTSSANLSLGGTGWLVAGQWPYGYTAAGSGSVALDESAFSVSPYAPEYGQLLSSFDKAQDTDIGNIWNQLSLIDTQMGQTATTSFLSDVAALEAPEVAAGDFPDDYSILYLASINPDAGDFFDSIWRSTSNPLGRTWERILCLDSTNNDIILRIKQTPYDEAVRSDVVVYADRGADVVGYSEDEGQVWEIRSLTTVDDLALASDEVLYILDDIFVYRYIREDFGWKQTNKEGIQIGSGHTIAVPLKNPEKEDEETEDWVIVGGQGPPSGTGSVAWADFSQVPVDFEPPLGWWIELPVVGDVQAIADDMFEQNKTIYAASHDAANTSGKIYRWVMDESTEWEELEPPNTAFYGLAMRNDVLYGAWVTAEILEITSDAGVDRTLFPRDKVPPPPEWDYLIVGLPVAGDANYPVSFTREPSSLKISSNEFNNLWAIDNKPYEWTDKKGCLWAYTDTVAKVGPWTTSPASGDYIPVDPVTGRANEVNFRWRQLSYSSVYELQLAKDSDFSIRVLVNEEVMPVDQLSPECYFPAGGLVPAPASGIASWGNLEAGHTYYWRVRARGATTGEIIRSPWSATMYFTVEAGLPVRAKYPPVNLLSPPYGARVVSRSPGFSWSPIPKATRYEFVLAKDADLQQVMVKTNVPMTSYKYNGRLDSNTTYFWQVRAIEPVVSEPSSIGSFTVAVVEKPAANESPSPFPLWAWWLIVVCIILLIVMVVLAM